MKRFSSTILLLLVVVLATVLRFYQLSDNPPGLYIDEVSIGYNAHTILTKGVDEHGEKYPLMFKAFGEYKMPVYIYATSVAEYLFGKNEFAVRFTSALAGVLTVIAFYFLMKLLMTFKSVSLSLTYKKYLPLLSTFILAIAPWHIQFSRGGFEANVALLFYLVGIYFVVRFTQKQGLSSLLLATFFFALTFYTYFAYRMITPVTIICILLIGWRYRKVSLKESVISLSFLGLFLLPLLIAFSSGFARFSQTSAFSEYPTNNLFETFYTYPLVFLKNYLSHFSLSFLFVNGDGIGRHQMPWFGVLPKWEMLFLFVGIFTFIKTKKNILTTILFGLLLVAPMAAAFAAPSPQSLRSLLMIIPLSALIAVGLIVCLTHKKKLFRVGTYLILLLGCIESVYFVHHYLQHYPRVNQRDWGSGYKEIVQDASKEKDTIFVTDGSLPYLSIYTKYYNDSLVFTSLDTISENKKVIIVCDNDKKERKGNPTKYIYLKNNVDNEIVAQFREVRACY